MKEQNIYAQIKLPLGLREISLHPIYIILKVLFSPFLLLFFHS